MGRIIDRRRVIGGSLPYDAEIEFLKGNGSCYIDTLYFPTTTTEIEIKQTKGGGFDWGVRSSASGSSLTVGMWSNTVYSYSMYGSPAKELTILLTYIGKGVVTVNGQQLNTYNPIPARMTLPIALFCWHNDSYTPSNGSNCYIWYFKVWEDDALVRDFIPVRIGQVGYMYDKVSKQLFGNSGTGAFILGPDKGNKNPVNINVKTHTNTSLDVTTGDSEPVNILLNIVAYTSWTNGYIDVSYSFTNNNWKILALTSCLYDGQVYQAGDLIANWANTETKDITIIANYEEVL